MFGWICILFLVLSGGRFLFCLLKFFLEIDWCCLSVFMIWLGFIVCGNKRCWWVGIIVWVCWFISNCIGDILIFLKGVLWYFNRFLKGFFLFVVVFLKMCLVVCMVFFVVLFDWGCFGEFVVWWKFYFLVNCLNLWVVLNRFLVLLYCDLLLFIILLGILNFVNIFFKLLMI